MSKLSNLRQALVLVEELRNVLSEIESSIKPRSFVTKFEGDPRMYEILGDRVRETERTQETINIMLKMEERNILKEIKEPA